MSAKNARIGDVDHAGFDLHFTSRFHCEKVSSTEASRAVEALLQEIFKRPVRIRCSIDTAPAAQTIAEGDVVNVAEAAAEIF